MALAALSMIVGSLLAVSQTDMKRLLAYSSIAHAGYALLGLIPGTPEGASATMTYAFVYSFMTLGAFGVVIALGRAGREICTGYRGLAATAPGTAAVMLLFLLSLTGIPPTAGFTAKFAVILSAVRAGYAGLAVLAVICSVVSAFFYLRVAVLMYMTEPRGRGAGSISGVGLRCPCGRRCRSPSSEGSFPARSPSGLFRLRRPAAIPSRCLAEAREAPQASGGRRTP